MVEHTTVIHIDHPIERVFANMILFASLNQWAHLASAAWQDLNSPVGLGTVMTGQVITRFASAKLTWG